MAGAVTKPVGSTGAAEILLRHVAKKEKPRPQISDLVWCGPRSLLEFYLLFNELTSCAKFSEFKSLRHVPPCPPRASKQNTSTRAPPRTHNT